jgi:hypothetical protein
MFEKIDNFLAQWVETAEAGFMLLLESMQIAAKFVFNLFWIIVALFVIVFTFPLWFIGKVRERISFASGAENASE